eukprot:jgi/Hompol1/6279/HPOL_002523-RA
MTQTNSRNYDALWGVLGDGLRKIFRKQTSNLSFEELYRNAYDLCLSKFGDRLYADTRKIIVDHNEAVIASSIVPVFPLTATPPQGEAEGFLRLVAKLWEDHTVCLSMASDILMYLDRTHLKGTNMPSIYDMGLDAFRDVVVRSKKFPLPAHLIATLLHQIHLEREGELVNRMLLRSIFEMLITLPVISSSGRVLTSIYDVDFERTFLETSATYYHRDSQKMLKECNAMDYLAKTEQRLLEEQMRTKHYLSPTTESKIRSIVEQTLLEQNISTIMEMETGLVHIVSNDKYSDLQRMYALFARVPNGHSELRAMLFAHVKQLGMAINDLHSTASVAAASSSAAGPSNMDDTAGVGPGNALASTSAAGVRQASPLAWVEDMIALKDKFDTFLEKCFAKDRTFEKEINAALELCVQNNIKSPEYLSLFLDENLRKGIKGKSEEEIEAFLDKTIVIFRFVREKDVFERYYKQHLAKRMLYNRSLSEDTEKTMITKLKVECGYQFISKLEGMFKDMHISNDICSGFRASLSDEVAAQLPELFVYTLTSTYWPMPMPTSNSCSHPREILSTVEHFQRYYMSLHSGRRLTWLNHMGTADIRANFDKGRKELNVSTYAMTVLVGLFNGPNPNEAIPFERILVETEIPEADLKRTLQSLALGKYRILTKSTKTRDVSATDTFTFNAAFTSPLNKIKIQTIAASSSAASMSNTLENDTERNETLEKINDLRKHQVEAAIVRIMKSRKTMRHIDLVTEVIAQLSSRFAPDPLIVKKRIEGLIEREYLERDNDNRQLYKYLA